MGISLKTLAGRSFRTSKIRNLVAVLAVILTAVLFTTVTTIGIGATESLTLTQQMAKGSKSDGDFHYMTAEQFKQLENADFIQSYGLRMPVGFLTNITRHNIEFDVMDEIEAELTFCNPSHGTVPQAENEVVASDIALRELGVEPKVGAVVPIEFFVRNKKYTFNMVVAGWYKASNEQISMMWAGTAFREANPDIFQYTYETDRTTAGTYFSDFIAVNAWGLQNKMNDWVYSVGGNPEDINADNYLGALVNRATNDQIDPQTIWMSMVIVLLFIFCGYLLIYNVFDIAVMQEIRRYGLYRTIGMSKKQVKKLINLQAFWLSCVGIPLGLLIGFLIGKKSLPVIMGTFSLEYENLVVNAAPSPFIFLGAAFLTALTVFISTRKPVRVAANTPPIEAFHFVETGLGKRKKKRKSTEARLTQMAWSNLGRNKRRSLSIMVSLMLCIVLLNSVGIVADSIDVEKQVDYIIRTDFAVVNNASASNMAGFTRREQGLKEETIKDISKQSGVKNASVIYKNTLDDMNVTYDFGAEIAERKEWPDKSKVSGLTNDGYSFNLGNDGRPLCNVYGMSVDSVSRMNIQEGEMDATKLYQRMQNGEGVLVGVQMDRYTMCIDELFSFAEIGDIVTVYKDGEAIMELPVLARAALNGDDQEIGYTTNGPFEVGGDGIYLYLPYEIYQKIYDEPVIYKYAFDVEADAQAGIAEFLETYMDTTDTSITCVSANIARQNAEGNRTMITFVGGVIGIIFGIIGILNLINTIITTIITRRHEFATMQSIGMTKKQLTWMITYEGIYYAAGGCILGLLVSMLIGFTVIRGLTESMWYFSFHFTLVPAIIVCITLLVVGACIPSISLRLFHRGSVVEKLHVAE